MAKREQEEKAQLKVIRINNRIIVIFGFCQPVFLSKKEREELAIKKRQEEVTAQRKHMEEERQRRQQYMQEASGLIL